MKNIFKLMGIAFLACGMMAACGGKDDPENDTPDNPQPQQNDPYAKVTFGASNWEASVAQCFSANMASFGVEEFTLMKEQGNMPIVDMLIKATPGTYSAESTVGQVNPGEDENYPNGYNYYEWGGGADDIYSLTYFEANTIQTQNGVTGDWKAKTATVTVSAFDLNTLTASFNLTATMFDYYSWYYGDVDNATDTDEKPLTVSVNKYQFTEYTNK